MENIKILDYELFYDVVKALSKVSNGAKFSLNECGLTVYAKNDYSKTELTSNSISTNNPIEFCIGDLTMFLKILTTIKDLYKGDYSNVSIDFDSPFIKIKSGKFKTKIGTVEEEKIALSIGTKVHTELTELITFTTSSTLIKNINAHSFIFPDSNSARIYVTTESDMQNNTIFATIGNESNDLANSVTMELGLVNSGSLEDRKTVLNFERLNILNIIPSDDIKIMIARERPVMISKITRSGKNNSFFNLNVYSFMMVR